MLSFYFKQKPIAVNTLTNTLSAVLFSSERVTISQEVDANTDIDQEMEVEFQRFIAGTMGNDE